MLRMALVLSFLSVTVRAETVVEPAVVTALERQQRVPVIVLLGQASAANVRAEGSLQVTARWKTISGFAALVDAQAVQSLASDPSVQSVGLDVGGGGSLTQSIPLVGANLVQNTGLTGQGITVAVLDTGMDRQHPDLGGAIIDEHCFCRNADGTGCCPNGSTEQGGAGSAQDDHGHGTNVGGIILSRGTASPRGLAPAARAVSVKVMDSNNRFASSSQVLSGLDWVATHHPQVRVINMSLGTSARFADHCDEAATFAQAFAAVINRLYERGTLVFVSSGNTASPTDIQVPSCIRKAIAVGAVYDGNVGPVSFGGCTDAQTAADQVTCWSNSSRAVDILAPGAWITATGRGGGSSTFLGTSQAAPHVAGTAALLMEAVPSLGAAPIEALLEGTGRWILDPRNGILFPRLDSFSALTVAKRAPIPRRRAVRP